MCGVAVNCLSGSSIILSFIALLCHVFEFDQSSEAFPNFGCAAGPAAHVEPISYDDDEPSVGTDEPVHEPHELNASGNACACARA